MILRKIIIAVSLLSGLIVLAAAQAPPPIPALPDTPRLTTYSLTSSKCTCSVGFAIYGDGTDVDEWIQVFVNGVAKLSTDPTFGWALSSATGSLARIPRPITNAVLTFNTAQTASVAIVGARRPRRISQLFENRGVPAHDVNQIITDIIATQRESWDKSNRSIIGQPGEVFTPLPPPASRTGQILGFDSSGQPIMFSPAIAAGASVVLQVGSFPGADVGVQMNACLVALPATGGTCDARSLAGNNFMAETVATPDNATLLLCGVTLRGTVSPIMTYGSGSRILGCSQVTTTVEGFGGNNQIGIAPRNILVDTSNATISDLDVLMFGTTGTVGLQVIRHQQGVFNNLTFAPQADVSNTSIYIAANAGIAYYNQFYNMRVSGGGRAVDIEGNANENKFYGGFFGNGQTCFYFGPSDHNVFVAPSCEGWLGEAVHFEAATAGNQVIAGRFEGNAGTALVNNQSTSIESVIDAYVAGTTNSITDPNGTLDFSTNFAQTGGNKWIKHAPLQAQSYMATAVAPTVAAGQIGYGSTAVAAGAGTCPSGMVGGQTVVGCIVVNVAGTARNVPFF